MFDAVLATRRMLEELVDDTRSITAGLEHGLRAVEIFIAARLAGERRQVVELPLQGEDREVYYPVP